MQPEAREQLAAMRARALRDFVFVMRELQVDTARANVDRLAKARCNHRRAFDMPARPTAPPWAAPDRLLGRRRFPQHKIRRVRSAEQKYELQTIKRISYAVFCLKKK